MHTEKRTNNIVLTAALTGPTYSAARYPHIPLSVEEAIADAARCFEAGARAIHYHARNPATGHQFADRRHYRDVRAALAARLPGVPLSLPSSRKGEVEAQIAQALAASGPARSARARRRRIVEAELIRAVGVEARPDRMTTFTPPELLIAGETAREEYETAMRGYSDLTRRAWKDPATMRAYYRALTRRARALGVAEELEITTWKAFDVVERIALDPTLGLPPVVSFVVLLGYSASLSIARSVYEAALGRIEQIGRRAGVGTHVTIGAAIQPALACPVERLGEEPLPAGTHDYREVIEWVAGDPRVESFRVGLEDTPELFGTKPENAELVAHARTIFERLGIAIELDVAQVRRTFGLPATPPERRAA